MYNLLCCCECSDLSLESTILKCVIIACLTAIILVLITNHFSIYKNYLKEKTELEKSNKMAEITRENYRATPCSNYSCSNYSSTKAKAEETGNNTPDNNNNNNNNNETPGA